MFLIHCLTYLKYRLMKNSITQARAEQAQRLWKILPNHLVWVIEVERAKNSGGSSEPSQILIKNFRARASRAKVSSKISEPERAEPKFHQKFPSSSEPSFGSSWRAKNEPAWARPLREWRAKRAGKILVLFNCTSKLQFWEHSVG